MMLGKSDRLLSREEKKFLGNLVKIGVGLGILLGVSTVASSQSSQGDTDSLGESTLSEPVYVDRYLETRTGYGKRPRLTIGAPQYVSPSQLHEAYGYQVMGSVAFHTARYENTQDFREDSTSGMLRGIYGTQSFSAALDVGYTTSELTPEEGDQVVDILQNTYVLNPSVSYSFTKNLTAGLMGEMVYGTFEQRVADSLAGGVNEFTVQDDSAELNYQMATLGLSWHNEVLETGVKYRSAAKASADFDEAEGDDLFIYRPAQAGIFARGNLTDQFSLFSQVEYALWEKNAAGAQPLYQKFRANDRIAGKFSTIYWLEDRSQFSLSLKYQGGATDNASWINGFSSHDFLANQVGFDVNLTIRSSDKVAIGIMGGLMRGLRDDSLGGNKSIAINEETSQVGVSINAVL